MSLPSLPDRMAIRGRGLAQGEQWVSATWKDYDDMPRSGDEFSLMAITKAGQRAVFFNHASGGPAHYQFLDAFMEGVRRACWEKSHHKLWGGDDPLGYAEGGGRTAMEHTVSLGEKDVAMQGGLHRKVHG